MATFQTHPTPNPNSRKITTHAGPFVEEGLASFDSAEEARDHPLGEPLFSIQGVENVLIMPDFLTITKNPGANWDQLMRKVTSILEDHFEQREAS